jgi:hypothetical protein
VAFHDGVRDPEEAAEFHPGVRAEEDEEFQAGVRADDVFQAGV